MHAVLLQEEGYQQFITVCVSLNYNLNANIDKGTELSRPHATSCPNIHFLTQCQSGSGLWEVHLCLNFGYIDMYTYISYSISFVDIIIKYWRELRSKINNLNSSSIILRINKQNQIDWKERVARMIK
jgi:hypothetical protein